MRSVRHLRSSILWSLVAAGLLGCQPDAPAVQRPLIPIEELGEGDPAGEPIALRAGKEDAPLPEQVDHADALSPVRDQGERGTCMYHAVAAGVEAFAGLQAHVSVEQVSGYLKVSWSALLARRMRGMRVAPEPYWPYGGSPLPGMEERSLWGVDRAVSVGCNGDKLARVLADQPNNNVVLCMAWDPAFEDYDGVLYKPDLGLLESLVRKASCRLKVCTGHCVLLVGYEDRMDRDDQTRRFFKIKNSWSEYWGDRGYGYVSEAYVDQFCKSSALITEGPRPAEEPAPPTEEPPPTVEQPPPTVEQPPPTVEQPPPIIEQPPPTVEQPPSPGPVSSTPRLLPFGSPCERSRECADGICGLDDVLQIQVCTQPCVLGAAAGCPASTVCRTTPTQPLCLPPLADAGGCAVSHGASARSAPALPLLLLLLALALLRRPRA